MKKIFFTVFIIALILSQTIKAEEGLGYSINGKHHMGLRMGVWANSGGTHPELTYDPNDSANKIFTAIGDANFYLEGIFDYNIFKGAFVEISLGIVNRGTVTLFERIGVDTTTDIGNLLIYPMLMQFKYYPLSGSQGKFQPYFTGGGGIYYGRRNVQITNNYYKQVYGDFTDSETDFNYTFGAGFDWMLSNSLALDFSYKYMPVYFDSPLIMVNDYKASTITVGIKYMKNKKK